MKEIEVQREAVKNLRALGCTVFVTSSYREGRFTAGLPDIIVHRPGWEPGRCLSIEMKAPKGRTRAAQAAAVEAGATIKCISVEEVMISVYGLTTA